MTEAQLKGIIAIYDARLRESGRVAIRATVTGLVLSQVERLDHALWMCREILRPLPAALDTDKAGRWLGFIQGVLWTAGVYAVEELRLHNIDTNTKET